VKAGTADGVRRAAEAGLQPDLVYIDGKHSLDCFRGDLTAALDSFSKAIIVGDDWDSQQIHEAVETLARERGIQVETSGNGWRMMR
jgi:hypothetical protein